MDDHRLTFAERCEQALAAAKDAANRDERIAHLEHAVRFAQLAIEARKSEPPIALMAWKERRFPKAMVEANR
jgi:hypothetical protein